MSATTSHPVWPLDSNGPDFPQAGLIPWECGQIRQRSKTLQVLRAKRCHQSTPKHQDRTTPSFRRAGNPFRCTTSAQIPSVDPNYVRRLDALRRSGGRRRQVWDYMHLACPIIVGFMCYLLPLGDTRHRRAGANGTYLQGCEVLGPCADHGGLRLQSLTADGAPRRGWQNAFFIAPSAHPACARCQFDS